MPTLNQWINVGGQDYIVSDQGGQLQVFKRNAQTTGKGGGFPTTQRVQASDPVFQQVMQAAGYQQGQVDASQNAASAPIPQATTTTATETAQPGGATDEPPPAIVATRGGQGSGRKTTSSIAIASGQQQPQAAIAPVAPQSVTTPVEPVIQAAPVEPVQASAASVAPIEPPIAATQTQPLPEGLQGNPIADALAPVLSAEQIYPIENITPERIGATAAALPTAAMTDLSYLRNLILAPALERAQQAYGQAQAGIDARYATSPGVSSGMIDQRQAAARKLASDILGMTAGVEQGLNQEAYSRQMQGLGFAGDILAGNKSAYDQWRQTVAAQGQQQGQFNVGTRLQQQALASQEAEADKSRFFQGAEARALRDWQGRQAELGRTHELGLANLGYSQADKQAKNAWQQNLLGSIIPVGLDYLIPEKEQKPTAIDKLLETISADPQKWLDAYVNAGGK